jgi:fatty-acyl-CoA synthase
MKSVLTPLDFLERSAWVYRGRTAVVDGGRRFTYAQFRERVHRQASALSKLGIRPMKTASSPSTTPAAPPAFRRA